MMSTLSRGPVDADVAPRFPVQEWPIRAVIILAAEIENHKGLVLPVPRYFCAKAAILSKELECTFTILARHLGYR